MIGTTGAEVRGAARAGTLIGPTAGLAAPTVPPGATPVGGPADPAAAGPWTTTTVTVPTLTIGATHDTMDPAHMKWMSGQVSHGKFLLCPDGSHLSMWDDQEHFFPGVIRFLRDVDSGAF